MTTSKRLGIVLLVGAIGFLGLQLGERLLVPGIHGFVSTAQAVVGRPLTPEQRGRGGAAYDAALRSGRLQLLAAAFTTAKVPHLEQ